MSSSRSEIRRQAELKDLRRRWMLGNQLTREEYKRLQEEVPGFLEWWQNIMKGKSL